jgi:hypothetical protein
VQSSSIWLAMISVVCGLGAAHAETSTSSARISMHELGYSLTLSRLLPTIRLPAFPTVLIGNQIADYLRAGLTRFVWMLSADQLDMCGCWGLLTRGTGHIRLQGALAGDSTRGAATRAYTSAIDDLARQAGLAA